MNFFPRNGEQRNEVECAERVLNIQTSKNFENLKVIVSHKRLINENTKRDRKWNSSRNSILQKKK